MSTSTQASDGASETELPRAPSFARALLILSLGALLLALAGLAIYQG